MGGCYSKNLRTPEKEHSCSGEKASKFRCGYLGLGPDLRLYCCEKKTPLETEGLKTPLCPHRSRSVHCLAGGGGAGGRSTARDLSQRTEVAAGAGAPPLPKVAALLKGLLASKRPQQKLPVL